MENYQEKAASCDVRESEEKRVASVVPAIDATETGDSWKLYIDLPGVDQSSLDISVDKGMLTIQGAPRHRIPEGAACVFREQSSHRFERSFTLSDGVRIEGISAELRHGVLTVTLPKSENLKPRSIPITAR